MLEIRINYVVDSTKVSEEISKIIYVILQKNVSNRNLLKNATILKSVTEVCGIYPMVRQVPSAILPNKEAITAIINIINTMLQPQTLQRLQAIKKQKYSIKLDDIRNMSTDNSALKGLNLNPLSGVVVEIEKLHTGLYKINLIQPSCI